MCSSYVSVSGRLFWLKCDVAINYRAVVCACTGTCCFGGSELMICDHQRLPFHLISSYSLYPLKSPGRLCNVPYWSLWHTTACVTHEYTRFFSCDFNLLPIFRLQVVARLVSKWPQSLRPPDHASLLSALAQMLRKNKRWVHLCMYRGHPCTAVVIGNLMLFITWGVSK